MDAIRRVVGSVVVLDLSGRLTAGAGANQLRQLVGALAEEGQKKVLLNFSGINFMDSTGVGSLITCHELLRKQGGQLRIIDAQTAVRHVLRITGLDRVFPDFPDEKAALASFAS